MDITRNYFELFGLPLQFDVNLGLLGERYRELQKEWHPDRFAHLSDREQRLAVQYTAHLNEAMATLKSPLRRAQYLLALVGRDTHTETRVQLDPLFLMEQMELREELAAVVRHSDPEAELERLRELSGKALSALQAQFVARYEAGDFDAAEMLVHKMQFASKLQAEIDALEDRLYED